MKKFRKVMALAICLAICLMSVSVGFADGMKRTIFYPDTREKVPNADTVKSPYSAVCNLTINWSDGTKTYGTGFLISDTRVVTTAHCMYNRKTGATAKSIIVAPGDRVSGHPYGTKTAKSFHYPDEYETSSYPKNYDYGYMELSSAFAGSPATLKLSTDYDRSFTNMKATIIGFDMYTAQMYRQTEKIEYASSTQLFHRMDTLGGMSGSPVLDSNNKVVGINAYSIDGQLPPGNIDYGETDGYNQATRITKSVYNFLAP
jgi:V8-like Glu-specific endopeptidase